jgi:hypothetical protein
LALIADLYRVVALAVKTVPGSLSGTTKIISVFKLNKALSRHVGLIFPSSSKIFPAFSDPGIVRADYRDLKASLF